MMMDVVTDQPNTLEQMSPTVGVPKSDGEMTENSPLVQNTPKSDTPNGQDNSAKVEEKPLSPTKAPSPPQPIRHLYPLLNRPNVDWIQVLRPKSVRVSATFGSGEKDAKSYLVGDDESGGCIVILHLKDNPESVGDDGFYNIEGQ